MRLTQIKLAGFKSFVDPTHIPVPGQLVGVVGPNGCGKSNIIDAVRWVLGESRASALRGESMQDVIFNGSGERKPVGRASVELTFDNSLGKAAGQWSQYAEIAVKRVLERDGESAYYLNNLHVRRRDVTDMFLGTGLGSRPYAIIEQGMISRIIEAKPEELRVFLEEAAGVSKYRERRRETELRLQDARENLTRVEDIRQELEQQLTRLEQQAQVAGRFNQLQEQLKTTQALLWYVKRQDAGAARERMEQELARLEVELEAELARLRDAEKHLEDARERHFGASDTVHRAQGELYQANGEVARLEQQLEHMRSNRARIEQQIAATGSQLDHHRQQLHNSSGDLEHWRGEHEKALEQQRLREERARHEAEDLPLLEQSHRAAQESLAALQRELLLAEQGKQLEQSHRQHADKALQQFAARSERLEEEGRELPRVSADELPRWERELADLESSLARQQQELDRLGREIPHAQQALDAARQAQQSAEQRVTELDARRSALVQLQERMESDEKLKAWLTARELDRQPRLWQGVQVEAGWEDALEAVLRERLNAVGVEALERVTRWDGDPPPGKLAAFERTPRAIPSDQDMAEGRPGWRSLSRMVTCREAEVSPVLEEWLHRVYVVDSIELGVARRTALGQGEMLVTPQGQLITRSSITYYVPDSQLHGVLAREREIEALVRQLQEHQSARHGHGEAVVAAQQELAELEAALEKTRQETSGLQQERHEAQMSALRVAQTVERVAQRERQIRSELDEIAQQVATESGNRQQTDLRLAEFETRIEDLRRQVETARSESTVAEQRLAERRQSHQQALQQAQEAVYYEKLSYNKISELESILEVVTENIRQAEATLRSLQQDRSNLDSAPVEQELQGALQVRQGKELALGQARDALEGVAGELRTLEQERLTVEHGLEPMRQRQGEARLKEQESRLLVEQFEQQLQGMGADEAALAALVESSQRPPRPNPLQAEINRLNAEIAALGPVNLAALNELNTSRERKTYLDSQSQDLNEAVETLENAIRRIDRETRERLMATFDEVNSHLANMFPTLFGGGQAKLILTGEEILDAGMQVVAQPPGKKNTSIHLLSGGEKALTALSLVFSLFQLNPAPFCLLDEVDAPLDDTNTERFCQLVKRMAEQTQFMFISHNKLTMEIANQLIGITMQEQGVSRVVAVDIEEAMRLKDAVPA